MSDLGVVLVAILVVAVIWRGPRTLPKLGQALGRAIHEARREASRAVGRDANEKDDGAGPGARR